MFWFDRQTACDYRAGVLDLALANQQEVRRVVGECQGQQLVQHDVRLLVLYSDRTNQAPACICKSRNACFKYYRTNQASTRYVSCIIDNVDLFCSST